MTTSLEIEPVMNMSNSAEMTTVGGEGLQAILLEQQQCAVSWDQHWIQSESMLLLYLMTSHILWLFTASHILWLFTVILEVTNCVCSGYGGGYWIWKHKICLDTGGNIGGWIQIVTNWGEMHIPCPNSLQPSRYHLVSTTNTHRVQLVVWPQCSTDYNVDIV